MANGRIERPQKSVIRNAGLTQVGFIKIGEKSEKGLPRSLDYFIATGQFANEFEKKIAAPAGGKPRKLNIFFVSDDFKDSCNEELELWIGGKCYGKGDGVSFTIFASRCVDAAGNVVGYLAGDWYFVYSQKKQAWITQNKRMSEEMRNGIGSLGNWQAADLVQFDATEQAAKDYIDKIGDWKVTLTLRFVLTDLQGVLGVWSFTTKGDKSTIPNIVGAVDAIQNAAGRIKGIPFQLCVQKHISRKPGTNSTYPVVSIVPNLSPESIENLGNALTNFTGKMPLLLTDDKIHQIANGTYNALPVKTITTTDPDHKEANYVDYENVSEFDICFGHCPSDVKAQIQNKMIELGLGEVAAIEALNKAKGDFNQVTYFLENE